MQAERRRRKRQGSALSAPLPLGEEAAQAGGEGLKVVEWLIEPLPLTPSLKGRGDVVLNRVKVFFTATIFDKNIGIINSVFYVRHMKTATNRGWQPGSSKNLPYDKVTTAFSREA